MEGTEELVDVDIVDIVAGYRARGAVLRWFAKILKVVACLLVDTCTEVCECIIWTSAFCLCFAFISHPVWRAARNFQKLHFQKLRGPGAKAS